MKREGIIELICEITSTFVSRTISLLLCFFQIIRFLQHSFVLNFFENPSHKIPETANKWRNGTQLASICAKCYTLILEHLIKKTKKQRLNIDRFYKSESNF